MALSNAERQRRYIARLKQRAAQSGVSNASAPDPKLVRELAKAKIAALQKHRVPASTTALVQELAQAKARVAELLKALKAIMKDHESRGVSLGSLSQAARAAIAKAEGSDRKRKRG